MNIEADFNQLAWICIHQLDEVALLAALQLRVDQSLSWEAGCTQLQDHFDEPIALYYSIGEWRVVVSKYFFSDRERLSTQLIHLSQKAEVVHAFAIDVWANYFCYAKALGGTLQRFWLAHEAGVIEAGNPTEAERRSTEKETANKLMDMAEYTTIPWELMETFLREKKVQLLVKQK